MKLLKGLNFWFSLLAFPVLGLVSIISLPFVVGYAAGYLNNINDYIVKYEHVLVVSFYLVTLVSIWPFVLAVKSSGKKLSASA
jgi:hypothetical protein